VSKQNWNPSSSSSDTITIVKNGLEMRKLQPPKNKGGQKLKKNKPPNTKKAKHPKNTLYVALLLLEFKDDL